MLIYVLDKPHPARFARCCPCSMKQQLTCLFARTERIINDDPHVKSCVMFGRGKLQNGVLIQPAEDFVFDPKDVKKLEQYRNLIW